MELSSTKISSGGRTEEPRTPVADRAHATVMVASEFIDALSSAERVDLRERLVRLEASIAFWADDIDAMSTDNQRVRAERDELQRRLAALEDGKSFAEDARATIEVVLDDRDERIKILETGLLEAERRAVEDLTTRARMHALRRRFRDRMEVQSSEIEDLRNMVQSGAAARMQVQRELQRLKDDARRDGRYLDRLEGKLREAEGR